MCSTACAKVIKEVRPGKASENEMFNGSTHNGDGIYFEHQP